MHVFPGMEDFNSPEAKEYWHPDFVSIFVTIINTYKNSISLMAAGHIHAHEFRTPSSYLHKDLHIPIMVTPSVTPIF